MKPIIIHNPRCSKSRGALSLLKERGIEAEVVEYLKTPLDRHAIEDLLTKLNADVVDIVRTGEPVYQQLNLGEVQNDRDALIDAVVENPILLQRPILVVGDRAVVGRPPEAILDLLDA